MKVNSKQISPEAKRIAKEILGDAIYEDMRDSLAEDIERYARKREATGLYRSLLKADRELDQMMDWIREHPRYSGCKGYTCDEPHIEIQSRASYIIGFIESLDDCVGCGGSGELVENGCIYGCPECKGSGKFKK